MGASCRADRRRLRTEAGITIVEVVVSLALLGIILTATASSLVSLARQSSVSEHRLQATSLLTQLHENLQGIPWNRVALYEGELDGLAHLDDDAVFGSRIELPVDGVATFDGLPISTIPGPFLDLCEQDPDLQAEDCRLPFVPRAFQSGPLEFDAADPGGVDQRFEFYIYQIVTERPAVGDGPVNLKRFTTIVRWSVGGRDFEEVFESERAATSGELRELAEPNPRLLLVAPSLIEVQDGSAADEPPNWENTGTVDVVVRFAGPVSAVDISYDTADGTPVTLTGLLDIDTAIQQPDLGTAWTGTIPAGVLADLPAPDDSTGLVSLPLTVSGAAGVEVVEQVFDAEAFDPSIVAAPVAPVLDGSVGFAIDGGPPPAILTVARDPDDSSNEDVLCSEVAVQGRFSHSDPDLVGVTLWFAGVPGVSVPAGVTVTDADAVDSSVDFPAFSRSPWLSPREISGDAARRDERVYLIAQVTDSDGRSFESGIYASGVFTVERLALGVPCG